MISLEYIRDRVAEALGHVLETDPDHELVEKLTNRVMTMVNGGMIRTVDDLVLGVVAVCYSELGKPH